MGAVNRPVKAASAPRPGAHVTDGCHPHLPASPLGSVSRHKGILVPTWNTCLLEDPVARAFLGLSPPRQEDTSFVFCSSNV